MADKTYQQYLIQIDTFYARARYAKEINALLPIFTKDQELWLKIQVFLQLLK